jgi:hypothetical protein
MQSLTAPTTKILETVVSASHVPVLDLLGPAVELITPPDGPEDFCVLKGTIPPGVAVPLHSHDDAEAFFVLSGTHQALIDLTITTPRLARFLQEMGTPLGGPRKPPSPEDLARLSELAAKYGYWNATPEQNAAVGIELPDIGR